jgi:hypothetical protein
MGDKIMSNLEILKKNMSKKYCGETRFDYLDEEEIEMILKAMDECVKTKPVASTNSEIGSYHWFHTLLAYHKDMGEFLSEKTPDDNLLREWGKKLFETSKELINGFNYINHKS